MTSPLKPDLNQLGPEDLAQYGAARAKDVAFLAVDELWRRRKNEGLKQVDIARAIGANPTWVSRSLSGPANWTLRTLGALVEALDGELEIKVHAIEDAPKTPTNFHAYDGYGLQNQVGIQPSTTSQKNDVVVLTS